jgi:hypothetical protein
MPNGRCRLHGGKSPSAPEGNTNAFKHGRYSPETIEARRKIAALLRTTRLRMRRAPGNQRPKRVRPPGAVVLQVDLQSAAERAGLNRAIW